MKKILLATALAIGLAGCTVPATTTTTDKFTGHTTVSTRDHCGKNSIGDEFCVKATKTEATDSGTITFTYTGDDWLFMEKAQVRNFANGKTYTLFDVGHFDVSRDVWCCGKVKEWWTYSFKLSTAKTNNHPVAQFIRDGMKTPNAKLVFRVEGRDYYSNFE